jgi:hypothetical protein
MSKSIYNLFLLFEYLSPDKYLSDGQQRALIILFNIMVLLDFLKLRIDETFQL